MLNSNILKLKKRQKVTKQAKTAFQLTTSNHQLEIKKRLPYQGKTDASKQNEKPTLNKFLYTVL